MTRLVDDQILSAILRSVDLPSRPRDAVYTTGYWYVRLCQAVLGASERTGVLSEPFTGQAPAVREQALHRLLELPDEIGLVSLRTLGPLIAHLRNRHRLNALGMEALAAAVYLGASVHLSVASPRLEEALRAESISVVSVDPRMDSG